MALLAPITVPVTGVAPNLGPATGGGDTLAGVAGSVLHVKNGGGSSINVTITDPGKTPAGSAASNPVIAVPAGGERLIKLGAAFNDPTTGYTAIAYSGVTTVTVEHLVLG